MRYVQHKSGQGEMWTMKDAAYNDWDNPFWLVERAGLVACLPKSEYVEVPAPEAWIDVTSECILTNLEDAIGHLAQNIGAGRGYRLRKIQVNNPDREPDRWAFIVEKRQP